MQSSSRRPVRRTEDVRSNRGSGRTVSVLRTTRNGGTTRNRYSATVQCDGKARNNRRLIVLTDPETGVASGLPEAAMCVQDIDAQCVLQFTLVHAAGCALHRLASRVIHRLELSNCFTTFLGRSRTKRSQDDDGWLRRRHETDLSRDIVRYVKDENRIGAAEKTIVGSLNLRNGSRRWLPRSSRHDEQSRQVPRHFTGIHAQRTTRSARVSAERRPSDSFPSHCWYLGNVHRRRTLGASFTTVMILPQVHLRKPCYDFYFL